MNRDISANTLPLLKAWDKELGLSAHLSSRNKPKNKPHWVKWFEDHLADDKFKDRMALCFEQADDQAEAQESTDTTGGTAASDLWNEMAARQLEENRKLAEAETPWGKSFCMAVLVDGKRCALNRPCAIEGHIIDHQAELARRTSEVSLTPLREWKKGTIVTLKTPGGPLDCVVDRVKADTAFMVYKGVVVGFTESHLEGQIVRIQMPAVEDLTKDTSVGVAPLVAADAEQLRSKQRDIKRHAAAQEEASLARRLAAWEADKAMKAADLSIKTASRTPAGFKDKASSARLAVREGASAAGVGGAAVGVSTPYEGLPGNSEGVGRLAQLQCEFPLTKRVKACLINKEFATFPFKDLIPNPKKSTPSDMSMLYASSNGAIGVLSAAAPPPLKGIWEWEQAFVPFLKIMRALEGDAILEDLLLFKERISAATMTYTWDAIWDFIQRVCMEMTLAWIKFDSIESAPYPRWSGKDGDRLDRCFAKATCGPHTLKQKKQPRDKGPNKGKRGSGQQGQGQGVQQGVKRQGQQGQGQGQQGQGQGGRNQGPQGGGQGQGGMGQAGGGQGGQGQQPGQQGGKNNKVCWQWQGTGRCSYGSSCSFIH